MSAENELNLPCCRSSPAILAEHHALRLVTTQDVLCTIECVQLDDESGPWSDLEQVDLLVEIVSDRIPTLCRLSSIISKRHPVRYLRLLLQLMPNSPVERETVVWNAISAWLRKHMVHRYHDVPKHFHMSQELCQIVRDYDISFRGKEIEMLKPGMCMFRTVFLAATENRDVQYCVCPEDKASCIISRYPLSVKKCCRYMVDSVYMYFAPHSERGPGYMRHFIRDEHANGEDISDVIVLISGEHAPELLFRRRPTIAFLHALRSVSSRAKSARS